MARPRSQQLMQTLQEANEQCGGKYDVAGVEVLFEPGVVDVILGKGITENTCSQLEDLLAQQQCELPISVDPDRHLQSLWRVVTKAKTRFYLCFNVVPMLSWVFRCMSEPTNAQKGMLKDLCLLTQVDMDEITNIPEKNKLVMASLGYPLCGLHVFLQIPASHDPICFKDVFHKRLKYARTVSGHRIANHNCLKTLQPWAFVVAVALCDEYVRLRKSCPPHVRRYLQIMCQLPLEMQMHVAYMHPVPVWLVEYWFERIVCNKLDFPLMH